MVANGRRTNQSNQQLLSTLPLSPAARAENEPAMIWRAQLVALDGMNQVQHSTMMRVHEMPHLTHLSIPISRSQLLLALALALSRLLLVPLTATGSFPTTGNTLTIRRCSLFSRPPPRISLVLQMLRDPFLLVRLRTRGVSALTLAVRCDNDLFARALNISAGALGGGFGEVLGREGLPGEVGDTGESSGENHVHEQARETDKWEDEGWLAAFTYSLMSKILAAGSTTVTVEL